MSTIEDFVATRSSDLASPPVMLTPDTWIYMDQIRFIGFCISYQILWIDADLWFGAEKRNRLGSENGNRREPMNQMCKKRKKLCESELKNL